MRLIGQLAKDAGMAIHTIRYYERFGLIKGSKDMAVTSNNYSMYQDEVVGKLKWIKQAKLIGFTLAEIKSVIDVWHDQDVEFGVKKEAFLKKAKEIDEKINQLNVMKKNLLEILVKMEKGAC